MIKVTNENNLYRFGYGRTTFEATNDPVMLGCAVAVGVRLDFQPYPERDGHIMPFSCNGGTINKSIRLAKKELTRQMKRNR